MRKFILLSFILLCSWSATAETDLKQQLSNTINDFLYGASINDPQAHAQFWADGLTYTSSRGTRYNKAVLMSGLEGVEARDPKNVNTWYGSEAIEIKPLGEAVIVNFTLTSATNGEITDRFYNTGVFVYRDGRWQAINWNATTVKD